MIIALLTNLIDSLPGPVQPVNSLFVNIAAPPSFPSQRDFPVRVFIHGGCVDNLTVVIRAACRTKL